MADFLQAAKFVLKREGGYVNDPADPGGATNMGITQNTYTAWLKKQGLPNVDVRKITTDEVHAIYREHYWEPVVRGGFTQAQALIFFDTAVNFGVGRAKEWMDITTDPEAYLCVREAVYRWMTKNPASSLSKFRKGWLNRVKHLRAEVGLSRVG